MPYFFMSHARGRESENDLVRAFFDDLCSQVRLRSRARSDDLGFLDLSNLTIGEAWSLSLRHALGSCGAFLALGSGYYFNSAACGAEWAAFDQRCQAHAKRAGRRPQALMPLYWVRFEMPELAHAIQFEDPTFDPAYSRDGILGLLQDDQKGPYYKFVAALAKRIVEVATRDPLPPTEVPELQEIVPAFGARVPQQPRARVGTKVRPSRRPTTEPPGRPIPNLYGEEDRNPKSPDGSQT